MHRRTLLRAALLALAGWRVRGWFPDGARAAPAPVVLTPYLTAPSTGFPDGYWIYLAPGEQVPAGATRGAVRDSGAGYLVRDTTTAAGKRLVRDGEDEPIRYFD